VIHIVNRDFLALTVGILLCSVAGTVLASTSSIEIDKAIYFFSTGENLEQIPAGRYDVQEGDGNHLRLIANDQVFTIPAEPSSYEPPLSEPTAMIVTEEGKKDDLHVVLLLQDGKALDATASFSNVRTRGPSSQLTRSQIQTAISQSLKFSSPKTSATISPAIQQALTTVARKPYPATVAVRPLEPDPKISIEQEAREALAPPEVKLQLAEARERIRRENLSFDVGYTSVAGLPLESVTGDLTNASGTRGISPPSEGVEKEEEQAITTRGGCATLPTFSWRDRSAVTPVKNQGQCGSCVGFAVTAALEASSLLKNYMVTDFAEQFLLDTPGAVSCKGGIPDTALGALQAHGVSLEEDDPYEARNRSSPPQGTVAYQIQKWETKSFPSREDIKRWLCMYGPLVTSMVATPDFQAYLPKSGNRLVFDGGLLDDGLKGIGGHAVLLVGWDDFKGAWLIKNSWGNRERYSPWGIQGYGWVKYGHLFLNFLYIARVETRMANVWREWKQMRQSSPPARAAVNPILPREGAIDLFTIGQDNRVYMTFWDAKAPTSWQPFALLKPLDKFETAPAARVTATVPLDNRVDLFTIGKNGGIYTNYLNYFEEPVGWQDWAPVGTLTAYPGSQVSAIVPMMGHSFLFTVGSDGKVYWTRWERRVGWQPSWDPIYNLKAKGGSQITAIVTDVDRVQIFFEDDLGKIRTVEGILETREGVVQKTANGGVDLSRQLQVKWQPPQTVDDLTITSSKRLKIAANSQMTAFIPRAGHIDLFVVDQDLNVYSTWWEYGHGWQLWFPIHNIQASPDATVTAITPRPDHIDLFVTDKDGQVQWSVWEPQLDWIAWRKLPPLVGDVRSQVTARTPREARLYLAPVGSIAEDNHIDLFSLGLDGSVQTTWWEPQAGWQPWRPIAAPFLARKDPGQFIGTFGQELGRVAFLYGIMPDGVLKWYRHNGAEKGLGLNSPGSWAGPQDVHTGWNRFKQVFPGGANILYGIAQDGSLQWYRHDDFNRGTPSWTGAKEVGIEWQYFKHVFSGGDGIIYAITQQGVLRWYRHKKFQEGAGLQDEGSWDGGRDIGSGWQNFKQVFGGCNGVIYAITQDGILKWYKHTGYRDGNTLWQGPKDVGHSWHTFKQVFGACDGIIYAIAQNGVLYWYKHTGHSDGSFAWEATKDVGIGWQNFTSVVPLLPLTSLPVVR